MGQFLSCVFRLVNWKHLIYVDCAIGRFCSLEVILTELPRKNDEILFLDIDTFLSIHSNSERNGADRISFEEVETVLKIVDI